MSDSQAANNQAGMTAATEAPALGGTFWSAIGRKHLQEIDNLISSNANRARSHGQLSLEGEELQRIFQATLVRRNACAPISRLSPDIMVEIFDLIIAHLPLSFPGYNDQHIPKSHCTAGEVVEYSLGWIPTVTHVCHRWREIALEVRKIWANDVCAIPCAQDEFLRRAQDASLTLRMHRTPDPLKEHPEDIQRYKFIIKHLSHARAIEVVDLPPNKYLEFEQVLSSTAMPFLETISYKGLHRPASSPFDISPIHSPRLQRVTIHERCILWNAVTLTELDLDQSPKSDAELPTFSQLSAILSALHNLQRLHLCHWIPEPSSQPFTVAELPHLSYISLTGHPNRCRALFDCLSPSPFAEIDLDMVTSLVPFNPNRNMKPHIEESFRLFKVLSSKIHFGDVQNPLHPIAVLIEATWEYHGDLELQLFASTDGFDDEMSDVEFAPFRVGYKLAHRILLPGFENCEAYVALLECLFDDFGLQNVEKLAVRDVYMDWDVATWRSILSRYPKTQALYFPDQSYHKGFNAALRASSDESHHAPFLPNLNLLSFERMDDCIYLEEPWPMGQEGWLPDIFEDLALTLETRAAMGIPLSRVEFDEFCDESGVEYGSVDAEIAPPGFAAVWNTFKTRAEAVLTDGVYQCDEMEESDIGGQSAAGSDEEET